MSEARQRSPRGPSRFRESDVVRALRAAQRSNVPVQAVKITVDGDILLVLGDPPVVSVSTSIDEGLDRWREMKRRAAG